jgi:ABC-type antimicrobial peptide transport system permease subunit
MLRNYFKTAWRSLSRNKAYSVLNILGLATGMAVALLIGLWVHQQYSYDRFLPGYSAAYQVRYNYNNNGEINTRNEVCIPLAAAMKNDIPEVAHVALCFGIDRSTLAVGDKILSLDDFIAGEDILKIFQYPLLKGNADQVLKDPTSIVITQSTAKALFGDAEPMGKIIRRDNWENLKVTGVLKDIPGNSTLRFDYITSFQAFTANDWVKAAITNWNDNYFQIFVSLKPNITYAQVESKIGGLVQQYAPVSYKTFQQRVIMQPLQDWHLYTDYKNGVATGGLVDYLRMFSIIGILVLLIACINFMNLSTARSEKRAREVGIRKVAGSSRQGLILQFLVESIVLTCLAFLVSLLIVQLALPAFNALAGTNIRLPLTNAGFWLIMLGYVLITGLLAGSRPAFYLSSFQPVKVLKSAMKAGPSATFGRKALVVLQFTCSIALIISTAIIYQQIQHAKDRPRGYDPNRLISTGADYHNYKAFKAEVMQSGVVSSMSSSLSPATEIYSHNTIDNWPGRLPSEPLSLAMNALGDPDYFKTLGISFITGRTFTGIDSVDATDCILNEAAVRRMRLKDPINQYIHWSLSNAPNRLRIIGVVKDALTNAPFAPAEPTIFVYQPTWAYTVQCRLSPNVSTQSALAAIKSIFDRYNPGTLFQYHFEDENYATKFQLEMLVGRLAGIFAAFAVFISCLGLFGLAAYVAEQRTKEIGIRKVLGASVPEIFLMLTKDFIVLVIISCVIASPIAFYFLQGWLQQYTYRISISPLVFVGSAIVAIAITAITISFQAIRAALMNPTKSLKAE